MSTVQRKQLAIRLSRFMSLALLAGLSCAATSATIPQTSTQERTLSRSWVNLERYSGRPASSPSTQTDYQQLVYELQALRTARKATGLSVAQQAPYETINQPRNNLRNRVPLSLLHWKRTLDVFTSEQQRQAQATGVVPEPIQTNITIFAVAPVRPTTYRGAAVEISLSADDFFEETGGSNTIRSLRFDAGDGNGWRDLAIGTAIDASYNTVGLKTVIVEATLSDGAVLLASASLDVVALSSPDPTQSVTLVAEAPYNNTTGTIYILKSGPHVGLRCPVLVAEGFDMENSMDWDVLYNILNKEQLTETLGSYGRDLIVLDYTNAMRNIFENAALARKAVKYVNANRYNASDKFAVIGASMGGLVTRIALADMDRDPATYGISHVNTWISFDSPHKGANIPLGIQEFLAFFYNKNSAFAAAAKLFNILNQPAARQMLLVHHSTTTSLAGNISNTAFQASLDVKGYPTSCKKIAISNGSGYGDKQPFNDGEQVINWYYGDWFLSEVEIHAYVYALSTSTTPSVPAVFYGFWDTIAWFDEVSTTQQRYYNQSLDNSPGGTRNSFQILFDSTASRRGANDYCLCPDHCFIPMVSSLGIDIAYCSYALQYYPSIKALCPFDEIHYAYWNEPHIDINYNNKSWFMRAILEDYDTDADGYDDYQEYLIGTAYDSAASKLEGPKIYPQIDQQDYISLSWDWRPNVSYKVYFTENLARDWTLVFTGFDYLNWPSTNTATYQLTRSSPTGFYKIVAEVKDPVTN